MEKNRKSRKIAKVALAGVSLMAVSAITFGATMAYLTADAGEKVNTFSASASVKIDLSEPNWVQENAKITPNGDVPKNPIVTNGKDGESAVASDDAYVAIGLTFWKESSAAGATKAYTQISYEDFRKFASLEGLDTTNWTAATENTANDTAIDKAMVYYYNTTLADDNSTPALFTSVKFGDATALENLGLVTGTARYKDVKVEVTAYAVSAEGITDVTAKSTLFNMANPTVTP